MIKFIDNNKELYECLAESMDSYNNYYWSVAWMETPVGLYEKLLQNEHKIRLLVTGLYGFNNERGTSLDFVKFARHLEPDNEKSPRVLFITKKYSPGFKHRVILHSKLYYFENSDTDWRLVVGSANFSQRALCALKGNSNLEAVVVCDQDSFSNAPVKEYFERIRSAGENFRQFNEKEVKYYLSHYIYGTA